MLVNNMYAFIIVSLPFSTFFSRENNCMQNTKLTIFFTPSPECGVENFRKELVQNLLSATIITIQYFFTIETFNTLYDLYTAHI